MPGSMKREDHRKAVQQRLVAYAEDLVRRTMAQNERSAPPAQPRQRPAPARKRR